MDQNTLTLIGITECLAHLVNKEPRNRKKRKALRTLQQTKEKLIESSINQSACRQLAATTVQATLWDIRSSDAERGELLGFLDDLQEASPCEVWPPPLPSSSSKGKSNAAAIASTAVAPAATTDPQAVPRSPRKRR
jgi:hypothetical protein